MSEADRDALIKVPAPIVLLAKPFEVMLSLVLVPFGRAPKAPPSAGPGPRTPA